MLNTARNLDLLRLNSCVARAERDIKLILALEEIFGRSKQENAAAVGGIESPIHLLATVIDLCASGEFQNVTTAQMMKQIYKTHGDIEVGLGSEQGPAYIAAGICLPILVVRNGSCTEKELWQLLDLEKLPSLT